MRQNLLACAILAALLSALSAGCQGVPAPVQAPREETPAPAPTFTPGSKAEEHMAATPTPETSAPGLSAGAQAAAARAREDLAQRTGRRLETVRLVAVESVQWPDASLGCPQPDQMYAQVVTPGFRVVLNAAGQVYTYHTDQREHVVLCAEQPAPGQAAPSGTVQPGLEGLANQAKEDLAQRLSIPAGQIAVLEAQSVVWPDGSLGCPDPDMAYTQVQQEGVRIRLQAGQRVYSYHGGTGKPLFLCEQATTNAQPGE